MRVNTGFAHLVLARATTFDLRWRIVRGLFRDACRLLSRFNRGAVAADVSYQPIAQVRFYDGFMDAFRHLGAGQFFKRPSECRLIRQLLPQRKPTGAP